MKTIAASLCLLLCAAPALAEDRPPLLCGGVEPSWSLEIDAEAALFTAPDAPQIDYIIRDVKQAEGRPWPRILTLLAERDTALVLVRPQSCSDTMSDREFPWMIDMLTQRAGEAIAFTGCCRAAPTD